MVCVKVTFINSLEVKMNYDILNPDVSFPKDVFIQDDFNVDKFLQEYCSKSGLHKLHKELGVYIKYLQHVMIDIVNAESSAIVNLSSDLKILQNKFANITTPLGQFKEEVTQIFKVIDSNLRNIEYLLEQKEKTTFLKTSKINKLRVLISSQKISHILSSYTTENDNSEQIDMEVLERSVDQYILQQMYCQNYSFKELEAQINYSTNALNNILNNVFLQSLSNKNTDFIVRCLQMYMLMNNQKIAENLYSVKIVKPALQDIINENTLKICKDNLGALYSKIIEFVNVEMKLLLSIVHKSSGISGFNFVLNSVWLEVHEQLKLNMSSIYAPGNPAVFHQRFIQTCTFLSKFELLFHDNQERLTFLHHPSYTAHQMQWNLPVYYEIRHLEIQHNLEDHFKDQVTPNLFAHNDPNGFKLVASNKMWISLKRCFEADIYLPQLLDKFWRLNLQIVARFITWIQHLLKENIPIKEEVLNPELPIGQKQSPSTINLKLKFLTYLYLDIVKFSDKFNHAFSKGLPYLAVVPQHLHEIFLRTLTDPQTQLQNILTSIEEVIVTSVYNECSVYVKQISQIPRLFRKTNRNTPTVPSSYLALMSKPINNFYDSYKMEIDEIVMKRILSAIHILIIEELSVFFSYITNQNNKLINHRYKTLVENVLTSVTKTEESLRRLKKIRSGTGSQESQAITDDQKIKLQVQIDITHYCNKEAKQFVDEFTVNSLLSLIKESMDVK